MRLVIGLQVLLGRLGHVRDRAALDHRIAAAALLVAMAVHGIDERLRHDHSTRDAVAERAAHDVLAQRCQIVVLVQAARHQQLLEARAIEASGRLEHRIRGHEPAQRRIGHREAHVAGAQVEQPLGDQVLQRLLHHAELDRLLARELAADPLLQVAQRPIERVGELGGRDLALAHRRHRGILRAAVEHVADAPDREAGDEQHQQGLDDPGTRLFAKRIEHAVRQTAGARGRPRPAVRSGDRFAARNLGIRSSPGNRQVAGPGNPQVVAGAALETARIVC